MFIVRRRLFSALRQCLDVDERTGDLLDSVQLWTAQRHCLL